MKIERLSRRTLMRGAMRGVAASLALPWLEAMGPLLHAAEPGAAAKAGAPVRLAVLFFPNGVPDKRWTPPAVGPLAELSPVLAPLAEHKDDVLVLSKLWHKATTKVQDGHYAKDAPFLTGMSIKPTTGADIDAGGISMDQLVASRIGAQTRLPSIELSTQPVPSGVDGTTNIARIYGGHISWTSPTTPSAREIDPKAAFDRLFKVRAPGATGAAALGEADELSVLDIVRGDALSLRNKLGIADQRKLDEYMGSVRDLERRVQQDLRNAAKPRPVPPAALAALPGLGEYTRRFNRSDPKQGHQGHCRLMLDLMVMAFWTDATRVASFMFGNSVSGTNFGFLPGVTISHHDASHHENKPDKLAQYEKIAIWHVEQLAYLLGQLRKIKEGPGTLLDSSLVLFGSGLRDGNSHSPRDLPLVLAGRGGGVKPGRHIAPAGKELPMCNLLVELLHRTGCPVQSFGDSTGRMSELG